MSTRTLRLVAFLACLSVSGLAHGQAQTPVPGPLDTPAAQPPPTAPRAPPSPQMRAARQAMMQACAADMKTLCADAQPGGGKLMQCMRTHKRDLSPTCAGAMQSMREARGAAGG